MAVWQFKFDLLPQLWAHANDYRCDALVEGDLIRSELAWSDVEPLCDVDEVFIQMLPQATSWHPELSAWGTSGGHELNVWRERDAVCEISGRFDLRSKLDALPAHLIGAARQIGCVIFVPDQRSMFEPDLHKLLQHIRTSDAARFVADPTAFITKIPDR